MPDSAIRCLIFDFDGTCTDVDAEAAPFVDHMKADVADLLGRDLDAEWDRAQARIDAAPGKYGWTIDGRIIAPAHADPYIMTSTVAQEIMREAGVLQRSDATRSAIVQTLYHKAYDHTKTVFRPDAQAVLEAVIKSDVRLAIVTNAQTDAVLRKLDTMWGKEQREARFARDEIVLMGDARKYLLGDGANAALKKMPETISVEGLERPVYVQRGLYYEALTRVLDKVGAKPEQTMVCGDIFELDLALPSAMGMSVHLVTREGAPAYERTAIAALGDRAAWSLDLSAVLPRVGLHK